MIYNFSVNCSIPRSERRAEKALISTPPPPLILSVRKDVDEQSLNNVAQEKLNKTSNGKCRFSDTSVRPINKNLNSSKIAQKNLKTSKTEGVRHSTNGVRHSTNGVRHSTNGMRRYTNGMRRYTNGVRRYTNGMRRYTNGVRRYTNGVRRYTNGMRRYTNSPQIGAKSA